jgi:hypothetical protein
MTIEAGLVMGVKFLALILKVPRYVITEHLLQVGFYHIYGALQEPEKRQELQKHLEGRLGLKPVMDNGFGGKEYELPKSRIKLPKAPRRLSDSARKELTERLCRNSAHLSQNLVPVGR